MYGLGQKNKKIKKINAMYIHYTGRLKILNGIRYKKKYVVNVRLFDSLLYGYYIIIKFIFSPRNGIILYTTRAYTKSVTQ